MLYIILLTVLFVCLLLWGTRPAKSAESHALVVVKKELPIVPRPTNPLNVLPNELLMDIADFLDHADRACFAYTDRRAYFCIGRALKFTSSTSKLEFLTRLDREGFLPFDILCHECTMFHPPRAYSMWNEVEGRRACICDGNSEVIQQGYLDSPFLPDNVFFDIVAAVCRSFRLKTGNYIVNCLADRQVYKTEGAKISSRTSARICEGRLILKTENVLLLQPGPDLSQKVERLNQLLYENWWLTGVCGHVSWDMIWPYIFNPEDEPNVDVYNRVLSKDTTTLPVIDGWDLGSSVWEGDITCWTVDVIYPWAEWHSDEIWTCGKCSTNFKISVVGRPPDHPRANAIVFTSWKDLGSGVSLSDESWRGHMDTFDTADDDEYLPAAVWNWAAQLFEGIEGLGRSFPYMPDLGDVLDELDEIDDD
ncbi:hypothetical protein LCI18_006897 [Fusarium solani-melongenae]|uniref:Uncharacterized protein n=1 Tax=Fusarium solani subsp. cucurbitae TaxID=2747967 RepID=A0ACD3Z4E1_FUSSC|nr:hypothetical protein LCI18_006897 [Fusarium solani-melongenae]